MTFKLKFCQIQDSAIWVCFHIRLLVKIIYAYFLSSFWIWSYFFVAIYRHDLWSWRSHKGHFGRKSWSSSSLSWQRPSCLHQCWGTCKILWVKLCFKTLELNFLHRKKWYTQVSDFFFYNQFHIWILAFSTWMQKIGTWQKKFPKN